MILRVEKAWLFRHLYDIKAREAKKQAEAERKKLRFHRWGGRYRRVTVSGEIGFWLKWHLKRRGYAQAGLFSFWGKSSKLALIRFEVDKKEYDRLLATNGGMYTPEMLKSNIWEICP